ncbi:MAG: hypothetical protein GW878_03650 [Acidobacteria bacterium]|nr:hypothetical protein [Acidobacteriota bacterium]
MFFLLGILMAPPPPPTPTQTPTAIAEPAPITILRASKGAAAQPAPRGNSLAGVAAKVKLKLPADQRRLNNDSVNQLASGVELTMVKAGGAGAAGSGSAKPGEVTTRGESGNSADKALWQQRYQSARARVTQLKADIQRLDKQERELANQFYAWDDPNYRDGVIKPKWDQVKAVLERRRTELVAAQSEPDAVIDAARRAGAQPGWFRDLPEPRPDDFAPAPPAP